MFKMFFGMLFAGSIGSVAFGQSYTGLSSLERDAQINATNTIQTEYCPGASRDWELTACRAAYTNFTMLFLGCAVAFETDDDIGRCTRDASLAYLSLHPLEGN